MVVQREDQVMLSVDPGFTGTGWVLWQGGRIVDHNIIKPVYNPSLTIRGKGLHRRIRQMLKMTKPQRLVIEWPKYFDSAVGHTAAVRGDLTMLTLAASLAASIGWDNDIEVRLLDVNLWKGTMTKEAVINRIKKRLPAKEYDGLRDHCWDAAGIGLYDLGRF